MQLFMLYIHLIPNPNMLKIFFDFPEIFKETLLSLRPTAIPVGHFLLTATSVIRNDYNVGNRRTLDSCNLNGIVLAVKILKELTEELNRETEKERETELRSLCWRQMREIRKLIAQSMKKGEKRDESKPKIEIEHHTSWRQLPTFIN